MIWCRDRTPWRVVVSEKEEEGEEERDELKYSVFVINVFTFLKY